LNFTRALTVFLLEGNVALCCDFDIHAHLRPISQSPLAIKRRSL
jgi:hypothetical protein